MHQGVLALDTVQDSRWHELSSIPIVILHTDESKDEAEAYVRLLAVRRCRRCFAAPLSAIRIRRWWILRHCCREHGDSGGRELASRAVLPGVNFKLNSDGMVPVVVQDYKTDEVLMVAYMNEAGIPKPL